MVRGVIQHSVLPRAEAQAPERTTHHALADIPGGDERIAHGEPANAVAHERRRPAYIYRHDRKRQRHSDILPRAQPLRDYAGVCRLYRVDAAAVHLRDGPERVAALHAVHYIAGVPRQERPVRVPSGDAVGRQAVHGLKAAQGVVRRARKYSVLTQLSEARAVQRELEQLDRGADAAHA